MVEARARLRRYPGSGDPEIVAYKRSWRVLHRVGPPRRREHPRKGEEKGDRAARFGLVGLRPPRGALYPPPPPPPASRSCPHVTRRGALVSKRFIDPTTSTLVDDLRYPALRQLSRMGVQLQPDWLSTFPRNGCPRSPKRALRREKPWIISKVHPSPTSSGSLTACSPSGR